MLTILGLTTSKVEMPRWLTCCSLYSFKTLRVNRTREGKTFYYVGNRSKCITLKLRNHEYSKVVLEVDDKESIAHNLRKLLE